MIIWILLALGISQVAVGQEAPQRPQIIRTSPCGVPSMQCLQKSGMNLDSLMRPASSCGCGCGGAANVEVSGPDQLSPQFESDDEAECCCCGVDNVDYTQSDAGQQPFSVTMLAPLASVISSFMSGLGSSGNQAVTFDFDGQTCSNPIEDPPSEPQCDAVPYSDVTSNQSQSNVPLPPLLPHQEVKPICNNQPPPRVLGVKHPIVGPHCYRRPRKGYSDIEEDSLYAFAHNGFEKNIYNPTMKEDTALNLPFPQNRYSPDSRGNQQTQVFRNELNKQNLPRDNNLVQSQPSGNPDFDTISKLALSSSRQNKPYSLSDSCEPSLIPMI